MAAILSQSACVNDMLHGGDQDLDRSYVWPEGIESGVEYGSNRSVKRSYQLPINWGQFQYKDRLCRYKDSHYKDHAVVTPTVLIFAMGTHVLLKLHHYIESAHPPFSSMVKLLINNCIYSYISWERVTERYIHVYNQGFNHTEKERMGWYNSFFLGDLMHETSSKGNIFRVTGPLWGEFTGHRWISLSKPSDAELRCFLWSAPEQTVRKQSRRRWFETPSCPLWRHCNE